MTLLFSSFYACFAYISIDNNHQVKKTSNKDQQKDLLEGIVKQVTINS